jgi:hypothetical protein
VMTRHPRPKALNGGVPMPAAGAGEQHDAAGWLEGSRSQGAILRKARRRTQAPQKVACATG